MTIDTAKLREKVEKSLVHTYDHKQVVVLHDYEILALCDELDAAREGAQTKYDARVHQALSDSLIQAEKDRDQARKEYADLDEATRIRINELNQELDAANAEAKRWYENYDASAKGYVEKANDLDQARDDVVKLREAILTGNVDRNLAALTDTEHYEQYR